MSALPPKAAAAVDDQCVRYGPEADRACDLKCRSGPHRSRRQKKSPSWGPRGSAGLGPLSSGGNATIQRRYTPSRLQPVSITALSRCGKSDVWRSHDAALLQHRLHFTRAQPGAGLRYIGNILEDHHVIRIVGALK